jgi:AraC-like DNA-binding protein
MNLLPQPTLGGEQLIKTYLEQLLIFLIRDVLNTKETNLFPTKESMENHLVTEVRRTIAERAEAPLSIGELCARLGYSKSYLCRLFREQTGDTIAATATRERIAAARRLIREGTMNFSEISDRLGFDNPQYFSRVFRRVTGMTPSEFRASLKAR